MPRGLALCIAYWRSIVAIHGLDTGNPRTWVAFQIEGDKTSRQVHWLRDPDMLPTVIPDARIFTYDWNANTFANAANEALLDHSKTFLDKLLEERGQNAQNIPLLFVASCFGGLLLAKALNYAHAAVGDRSYRQIFKSTVGIVFLGTPFMGSTTAKTAEIRANIAKFMGGEAYMGLLEDLERENGRLDEIVEYFAELIHNHPDTRISVRCFFETKPTKIGNAAPQPFRMLLKPTIVSDSIIQRRLYLTGIACTERISAFARLRYSSSRCRPPNAEQIPRSGR